MKNTFIIFIVFISLILIGQESVFKELPYTKNNLNKTFFVPDFKDTSNLFFADTLVWKCKYTNDNSNLYRTLDQVSFKNIDTCKCFYENYIMSKKYTFSKSHFILKSKKEYATLIRQKDSTTFVYKENFPQPREVLYDFNFNNILATDTAFIENELGEISYEVIHYFQVKIN